MEIRNFDMSEDLDILNDWLKTRGLAIKMAEDIPANGFVAVDDDMQIAMGFLRLCEGTVALFDGLATDPEAPSARRHIALNEVVSAIQQVAKAMDITQIICWSTDPTVITRSRAHGYKIMPHTLAIAELSHSGHSGH